MKGYPKHPPLTLVPKPPPGAPEPKTWSPLHTTGHRSFRGRIVRYVLDFDGTAPPRLAAIVRGAHFAEAPKIWTMSVDTEPLRELFLRDWPQVGDRIELTPYRYAGGGLCLSVARSRVRKAAAGE